MGEAIRRPEYAGSNQLNRSIKPKKMQVAVERKINKRRTADFARVRKAILNFVKVFSFIGSVVGTMGLIIMLLVGYNSLSSINNEIQNVNSDIKELQAEQDYLMLKLEAYKEPERIEKLAEERLNMSKPKAVQVANVTIVDNFETIMANKNSDYNNNIAEDNNDNFEEQESAVAIGKVFNEIFH